MTTIPIEQLDERLTKALEQQDEHEAIGITTDAGTVAWVVRVPQGLRNSEAHIESLREGPPGFAFVVVRAKQVDQERNEHAVHAPIFGAGRGTLTLLSEDEEHLKDFQEYMG